MTSQVAAEAAGYQTSNKQGNTQREGGRSLACSASLALSLSSLYLSSLEWKIEKAVSLLLLSQAGPLPVAGEETEGEDVDL